MLVHENNGQTLLLSFNSTVLDVTNAHELRAAFKNLPAGPFQFIEIEFNNIQFLDSSGLGALLTLHKLFPADGNHQRPNIVIRNPRLEVANVFHLFRLNRVFTLLS